MATILAFMGLGPIEIFVILLVALLVFGRRLPEVARSLGQGMVEFRKGLRDEPDDGPQPLPPQPEANLEEEAEEDPGYDADSEEVAPSEDSVEDETKPAG